MSNKKAEPRKIFRNLPGNNESSISQIDKFRELAREIETVDSEEPLNAAIRKVAKSPPPKRDDKKTD